MSGRNGPIGPTTDSQLLRLAIGIREEWLGHALSTAPADRATAEEAISELYALTGQDRPRFVWVDSPGAALAPESPIPRASPSTWVRSSAARVPEADRPLPVRLADLEWALRTHMDERIRRRLPRLLKSAPRSLLSAARNQPPEEALRRGVSLPEILEITVGDSLRGSVQDALRNPLKSAFAADAAYLPHGLTWYGQHDAHRIGRYDAWRRLGLVSLSGELDHQLDLWAALARSCGWWWPDGDVCVLSERPIAVHSESLPTGSHGGVRLHRDSGPAVVYADGWGVYALHGTPVPTWVVTDPTVERIADEWNVEVRRTAIERIGWYTYIDRAGFRFVSTAPDPGNPGSELRLYDRPTENWGPPTRVLLTVNGSVERDGRRRRYGLDVPARFDDPIAAAGWSYGLSGELYARLARRT